MNERRGEIDVKLLLFAIQRTTAFENFLDKRFAHSQLKNDKVCHVSWRVNKWNCYYSYFLLSILIVIVYFFTERSFHHQWLNLFCAKTKNILNKRSTNWTMDFPISSLNILVFWQIKHIWFYFFYFLVRV